MILSNLQRTIVGRHALVLVLTGAGLGLACSGEAEDEPSDATELASVADLPKMAWLRPADGALVSGIVTLEVSPPSQAVKVVFFADGERVAVDRDGSPWQASLDASELASGTHRLEAIAKNADTKRIAYGAIDVWVGAAEDAGSPAPPPPPPTTPSGVVGYGRATVGGSDGPLVTVTSLAQLRTEIAKSGPKNLRLSGSGVWDLAGDKLSISKPNLTLDGSQANVVFKGGSVKITASQVILRHIKSRAGDETGNANDVDAITINGNRAPVDHVVLDHVEALWGPDVSSTLLGEVSDVTIQHSIMGEGLLHSKHLESGDADGHGLAYNLASEDSTKPARRITFYGDLITTSQGRQPRIIGGQAIDIIDCVFYNYEEGPSGNPASLNLVGNTWKWGPASKIAGLGDPSRLLWRFQPGGHGAFETLQPRVVYVSDAQTVGFSPQAPSGEDATVLTSSPRVPLSVPSIGSAAAYQQVLDNAGARLPVMDAHTKRLIDNVRNGTGVYYNGVGQPAPNPSWP